MTSPPISYGRRLAALSVTLAVVLATAVVGTFAVLSRSDAAATVSLGFVGDTGGNSRTSSVVAAARDAGVDAFFNLGDMSYNQVTPESAWCSLINQSAGNMPYELLAGNHEDDGPDGLWSNFASCLPDQLGVSGSYGQQYFVDYPADVPLVRMVMLSPKLSFPEGSSYWSYKPGTQGYVFAENAIDGARSAGIPFVVVGMHMYCLSMVNYPCYANTDLMNMLVAKHVDLYLQAHDHAYARSKQLALAGSCTALSVTAFNGDCVADADPASHYSAGNGTVLATVGPGGRSLNKQDPTKAVSAYFQTYMGSNNNPTYGYLQVDVTPTALTGTFVGASGGSYTDSFSITRSVGATSSPSPSVSGSVSSSPSSTAPAPSPAPSSVSLAPVADSWVGSDAPGATHGSDTSLYTDGSPEKVSYLKFDLSALAGRSVSGADLEVTTASSSWSGSPDTQRVHAVADSGWSEAGLSFSNAPPFGGAVLGSVTNTSGGGTTYSISLDVGAVQAGVGQMLSLAVDSSGGNAFYIGSRESATPPRLIVRTDTTGTTSSPSASGSVSSSPSPSASGSVSSSPSPSVSGSVSSSPSPSVSGSVSSSPSPSVSGSPSPSPSSVSLAPVADSWVGSDAPGATHGSDTSLYTDGSPEKVSYLKFDLSALAGRSVSGADLEVTTASSSWSGSPDTQRVHAVADSGWSEAGLSFSNAPPFGGAVLGSVTNTSGGGATYSISLDVGAVQAGVGQMLSLAVDNSGGNAFYIGSRESATPPTLVITTQ